MVSPKLGENEAEDASASARSAPAKLSAFRLPIVTSLAHLNLMLQPPHSTTLPDAPAPSSLTYPSHPSTSRQNEADLWCNASMVMHRDLLLRHRNPIRHRRPLQSKPPLHDRHDRRSREPCRSRRHCLLGCDSLCSLPRRLQFPSLPPYPRQSKRRHITLITAKQITMQSHLHMYGIRA